MGKGVEGQPQQRQVAHPPAQASLSYCIEPFEMSQSLSAHTCIWLGMISLSMPTLAGLNALTCKLVPSPWVHSSKSISTCCCRLQATCRGARVGRLLCVSDQDHLCQRIIHRKSHLKSRCRNELRGIK